MPDMPKITVARADYWQAIYLDDRKVFEHHDPDWPRILEHDLLLDVEVKWCQDQCDELGGFPATPGELVEDE